MPLKNINLSIDSNEIVGLLGDNGAGKSTLIKIINGYYQPDLGGQIYWKDRLIYEMTVPIGRELGIETVYQEKALAEELPLWQNIFMGREITRNGFLDISKMKQETKRLMNDIGFTSKAINENKPITTMSGGEKQGVAIARALYFHAELIILDEPTIGLSVTETKRVLDFIQEIKSNGKSCILIDHNIFHIFPVVDRIVVLDRGEIAKEIKKNNTTLNELTELLYNIAKNGEHQWN